MDFPNSTDSETPTEQMLERLMECARGWSSATFGWQDNDDPEIVHANYLRAQKEHEDECKRRMREILRASHPSASPQAALSALQPAHALQAGWQPIETAPKDGTPVWLYTEGLEHEDFNPTGSVEGYWQDDDGWIGAVWNGEQDCWDANQIVPTHWMPKSSPKRPT